MSSLVSPPNYENERRVSARDYSRQSHRVTTLGTTCARGVYFENIRERERGGESGRCGGKELGGCCWRPMWRVNDRKPAIWTWRLGTAPRTAVTYRQTAGPHRRATPLCYPSFCHCLLLPRHPRWLGYLTLVINRRSSSLPPRYVAGYKLRANKQVYWLWRNISSQEEKKRSVSNKDFCNW